jgi:hypothetical protein
MSRRRGSFGPGVVVVGALAVLVGGLGISGNLGAVGPLLGFAGGEVATVADPVEAGADPVDAVADSVEPDAVAWSCFWDPTMNDDWHDDVLCARGLETVRPTLLPDQSFVTEADMMAAAAEYEATLNE